MPYNRPRRLRGGLEVWLYFFFKLGSSWRWVVNATPRPLYSREINSVPTVEDDGWISEAVGPTGNFFFVFYRILFVLHPYLFLCILSYSVCTSSVLVSLYSIVFCLYFIRTCFFVLIVLHFAFCITTHNTNMHAPGGIRTRNPSKRSAADTRLRSLGHWDRVAIPARHVCIARRISLRFDSYVSKFSRDFSSVWVL